MKIEEARILIQKAFEDSQTVSEFKMEVHNILSEVYFKNGLISYFEEAKLGYCIDETGELTNQ